MKSPFLARIRHHWRGVAVLVGLLAGVVLVASPATASSPSDSSTTTTTTTTTTSTTTTTTPTTTTSVVAPPTTTTLPRVSNLTWPNAGSAAFVVPQLSVASSTNYQPTVPIASLTKMMTAWVVLHRLPLNDGSSGACETVNGRDIALYNYDVATDQSRVKIVLGQRLCERTLLRGMLVHSAGDYAQLLVALTGMHEATFVSLMNQNARLLGLRSTHYVDVTGILAGDRSTALDQATLASDLMMNEPIVQSIVKLPSVSLPLAGVVVSFTPFVGRGNVVGVKSGYTNAAGGCDVMAVENYFGNTVITTYVVVLGQHGSDPVGLAGTDALALSRSLRTSMTRVATSSGTVVQWIGSPADVITTTSSAYK